MIPLATLTGSVYILLPLLWGLTFPDSWTGGRDVTQVALLLVCTAVCIAIITPYRRFHHQTPGISFPPISEWWSALRLPLGVAAGVWTLLLLFRDYPDRVALAAISVPGMFAGAWAWAFWWRSHHLEARLQEISELYRHRDATTGLLNHRTVYEALEQRIREASLSRQPLSVIRLDLDRFTLFNATHGHRTGDDLLRQIAQTMKVSLSPQAIVGRYDADEFLIILPGTMRSQAVTIAHYLRDKIRQEALVQSANGQIIPVTASFGVAGFPEDADSAQGLLSIAESALLAAKQRGAGVADSQSSWRTRYRIQANGAFSTLEAMVIAIDHKDHYTRRHSEEVTEYAQWIAEELGLSDEQKHTLRLAGLVHDVGKIGIPDEVLLKPDTLNATEYETMKQHAVLGAVMLAALPGMEQIVPTVRSHHERWDGRGYPDGLAAEEIPFLARLLAVADAFSAMTTDRPYRRGMDWQAALAELQRQKGKQFDPVAVDAFVAAVNKRTARQQKENDSLPKAA